MLTVLSKIASGFNQVILQFEKLGSIPLLWILLFLQFGFLILIRPMFPNYWDAGWASIVIIYILILIGFIQLSRSLPESYQISHVESFSDAMLLYPLAFVGMLIILMPLKQIGYFETPEIPQTALIINIMLQCIIISPSEEVMFRGALYHVLKWKMTGWIIPMIITSVIFSVFHLGAYGNFIINWPLFLIAFIMSCIFCILTDRFGLVVAMACHASWNCVAIGLIILKPEILTLLGLI